MTVPNTPAGPDSPAGPDAHSDPFPTVVGADLLAAEPEERARRVLPELAIGGALAAAGAVLGLAAGGLWYWLAPRVPLIATTTAIQYADPEGEQRVGADGVFTLIGLGAGLLTALVVFLLSRRRGGGIAVALGLAAGGLLGSLIAWWFGMWLGPGSSKADVIAQARHAGVGVQFGAGLELGATGALLVWPMSAMVVLLGLSAAFGKREEDPPPYWAGPVLTPTDHHPVAPAEAPSTDPAPADAAATDRMPTDAASTDSVSLDKPGPERPVQQQ
ncbi:hypothetical protein CFP65_1795 [Kitasatospora sp. MMS16-BH015]|uniref:hypothetical protein n=1 Tax=Kitasatospora sp. MMS16-BH015 TaxID=2018025 RepID=UPI000CA14F3F|nr:hypothetical protein [Kitasatospora sp. MMS16-BH015]AUG76670.1 hypothetical protein CFP65_1795 [Kitasatospora sp. MMS16-BH015]